MDKLPKYRVTLDAITQHDNAWHTDVDGYLKIFHNNHSTGAYCFYKNENDDINDMVVSFPFNNVLMCQLIEP